MGAGPGGSAEAGATVRVEMNEQAKRARGELARMIQRQRDAGVSEREMARRADRAGEKISNSQLNKYKSGEVAKAPDGEQVRALAAALNVSLAEVRRAVIIDWYGYDPAEIAGAAPRLPERLETLFDALGFKLMAMDDAQQREIVNEIMRKYVLGV